MTRTDYPSDFEFHGADDVEIKQMVFPHAGTLAPQHVHTYDHTTMLAAGVVSIWADEEYLGTFKAPTGITIKAGVKHKFLTLSDNVIVYCIHNVVRSGVIETMEV